MKTEFSWVLILKKPLSQSLEMKELEPVFLHWKQGFSQNCSVKDDRIFLKLQKIIGETGLLVLLKREHGNTEMAIGKAEIGKTGTGFWYKIEKIIHSSLQIQNLLSTSDIELSTDNSQEYVYFEQSDLMIRHLLSTLQEPYVLHRNTEQSYKEYKGENALGEYAQRNENCERMWGLSQPHSERSEFQRDRERIVNSKAFRRMVDKAQIFTSSKGDHYRTRMTHTLEVAQIARSIANSLSLNIDLTEAIAFAHDLGHTPFGHQGERTLDNILKGKIDVGQCKEKEQRNIYGGFKHNFQSVRVLSALEEKYIPYAGLDVSFQVLEGVLKHTGCHFCQCSNCNLYQKNHCKKGCCDLDEFINKEFRDKLYPEYEYPTTLEGQVVAIADEIAQRSHDLDDAFTSKLLGYEEFCDYLKFDKMQPLQEMIKETYAELWKCSRSYIDFHQMLYARIISDVINYLVNDVVRESRQQIDMFLRTGKDEFYLNNHRFSKKLIDFTEQGGMVCSLLEKLISKKAINCLEVTWFDRNAEVIVKEIFQAYYENPRLMHDGTLRKLYLDMQRETGNALDFLHVDPIWVTEEFDRIRGAKYCAGDEYWIKNKILMRSITDYIAGMTDSFATNEYDKLM